MSPRDWRPSRASRTWRARARPPRPRSEHTRPRPHPPPGGRLGYGLSSVAKLGSLVLHMMPFWIFEVSPGGSSVRRSHEDGRVSWQGAGAGGGLWLFSGDPGVLAAAGAAAISVRPGVRVWGQQALLVQEQRRHAGWGAGQVQRRAHGCQGAMWEAPLGTPVLAPTGMGRWPLLFSGTRA